MYHPSVMRVPRTTAVVALMLALVPTTPSAQAPSARDAPPANPQTAPGDAIGSAALPLPALTDDARRLVLEWQQDVAGIVSQFRVLQQQYRDAGRAEDAAAVAAQVRSIQHPGMPVSRTVTAELVNEGLPAPDAAVLMSLFRDRAGQSLSFAVRGRDDQPVWGTTVYTDDSGLETAAVHAGLLRPGQLGIVKVTLLPGRARYVGSTQHGIVSSDFATHAASFQFGAVSISRPERSSSLSSYRDLVGQSITVPVVGAARGEIWGTNPYTDDSSLAAAVIHSGLLAPGEFGFVKVTILPGQPQYDGSSQNGIISEPFGSFDGSFRLEAAAEDSVQLPGGEDASRLVNVSTLRAHPGASFVVQVIGSTSGTVWGTGPYTDDSSIAAAAVHDGLLKPGELGMVRVIVDRGRQAYAASSRNGVATQPYGPWEGSFRLEAATR
jgi:hypothetical protein